MFVAQHLCSAIKMLHSVKQWLSRNVKLRQNFDYKERLASGEVPAWENYRASQDRFLIIRKVEHFRLVSPLGKGQK